MKIESTSTIITLDSKETSMLACFLNNETSDDSYSNVSNELDIDIYVVVSFFTELRRELNKRL